MAPQTRATTKTTRKAGVERARAAATRAKVKLSGADDRQIIDFRTAPLNWWRERWKDKDIRRLFIESFIYIRNKFDENKLVLLKFNDVQADLHERRGRKAVVLKARKQGLSRYFLASEFADAVVMPGQRIRIVPHDPETEEEFWSDLQTMYEMLPEHLKPFTRYFSQELIHFHDPRKGTVDSRFKTSTVQPGREAKGRGQAITRLHVTEMPFWSGDQRKAAQALFEAAAEGEINVESTAQGMESFENLYRRAKKGEGGWQAFFFAWWWMREYVEPGASFFIRGKDVLIAKSRDEIPNPKRAGSEAERADLQRRYDALKLTRRERAIAILIFRYLRKKEYVAHGFDWRLDEVAERILWRRLKIEEMEGGERDFLVEYPENDRECFTQSGRPVIADEHLRITCSANEPMEGHEYLIGVDGSAGKERGDPSSIQILDMWTGAQVHGEWLKRTPDAVAERAGELSDLYNGAQIVPERNSLGVALIQSLVEKGYGDRLFRHPTTALLRAYQSGQKTWDEVQEQADYGFYTDKFNKPLMGRKLEEALRKGELGLSSQEWIDEAQHVVWLDNGSFAAQSGHHDDGFMALAIINLVRVLYYGQFGGFVGVEPEGGELN
ncbi:MAG: hypothetical protein AB7U82_33660 [Blastocatellales bacterium]